MIWVFLAAAAAGFFVGLRCKVHALGAVSGLTFLACVSFALFSDMGRLSLLLITFGLLGVLQVGFLGGAALVGAWREREIAVEDDADLVRKIDTALLNGLALLSGR